jgi:hypothetical protein
MPSLPEQLWVPACSGTKIIPLSSFRFSGARTCPAFNVQPRATLCRICDFLFIIKQRVIACVLSCLVRRMLYCGFVIDLCAW